MQFNPNSIFDPNGYLNHYEAFLNSEYYENIPEYDSQWTQTSIENEEQSKWKHVLIDIFPKSQEPVMTLPNDLSRSNNPYQANRSTQQMHDNRISAISFLNNSENTTDSNGGIETKFLSPDSLTFTPPFKTRKYNKRSKSENLNSTYEEKNASTILEVSLKRRVNAQLYRERKKKEYQKLLNVNDKVNDLARKIETQVKIYRAEFPSTTLLPAIANSGQNLNQENDPCARIETVIKTMTEESIHLKKEFNALLKHTLDMQQKHEIMLKRLQIYSRDLYEMQNQQLLNQPSSSNESIEQQSNTSDEETSD